MENEILVEVSVDWNSYREWHSRFNFSTWLWRVDKTVWKVIGSEEIFAGETCAKLKQEDSKVESQAVPVRFLTEIK